MAKQKIVKDFIDFETGFRIIIVENSFDKVMSNIGAKHGVRGIMDNWWTGYVGVRSDNSLFAKMKKTQKFPDFEVFGGVTFIGDLSIVKDEERFFIGFDTNHYGNAGFDLARVEQECHKLAQQIYELCNPLEQIFKEALK